MDKEFVPSEQAKELRELLFDEPCFAFYNHNRELLRYMNPDKDWNSLFNQTLRNSKITLPDTYTTPTFSQAFRWFREKHQLLHSITEYNKDGSLFVNIRQNKIEVFEKMTYFDISEYEEAELECLKKLIELVKNK